VPETVDVWQQIGQPFHHQAVKHGCQPQPAQSTSVPVRWEETSQEEGNDEWKNTVKLWSAITLNLQVPIIKQSISY